MRGLGIASAATAAAAARPVGTIAGTTVVDHVEQTNAGALLRRKLLLRQPHGALQDRLRLEA
jgi:hypothetical protein